MRLTCTEMQLEVAPAKPQTAGSGSRFWLPAIRRARSQHNRRARGAHHRAQPGLNARAERGGHADLSELRPLVAVRRGSATSSGGVLVPASVWAIPLILDADRGGMATPPDAGVGSDSNSSRAAGGRLGLARDLGGRRVGHLAGLGHPLKRELRFRSGALYIDHHDLAGLQLAEQNLL